MAELRKIPIIITIILAILIIASIFWLLSPDTTEKEPEINETSTTDREKPVTTQKGFRYSELQFYYHNVCRATLKQDKSKCQGLHDQSLEKDCISKYNDALRDYLAATGQCEKLKDYIDDEELEIEEEDVKGCRALKSKDCSGFKGVKKELCLSVLNNNYKRCIQAKQEAGEDPADCTELFRINAIRNKDTSLCGDDGRLVDSWLCQSLAKRDCQVLKNKYEENYLPFMAKFHTEDDTYCNKISSDNLKSKCLKGNLTEKQAKDIFW